MALQLDARGLACPAPVLKVKDQLETSLENEVVVIVDNEAAKENVSRFLGTKGYATSSSPVGDNFEIHGVLDAALAAEAENSRKVEAQDTDLAKILVLVATDSLGNGDVELGRKLMISYIKTIKEMGGELWHLIFVNGGVKLTIGASPVLEEIKEYEQAGTVVLVCGTCLEHFKLTPEKQVGATTNMLDIVTATQLADKVITIS